MDEQSAENVKHKEMVEELTAECVKLKQVRSLHVMLVVSLVNASLSSKYQTVVAWW